MTTQVDRIIAKFGGVPRLVAALKALGPHAERDTSTIYRWTRKRPIGTGGVVPASAVDDVNDAAAAVGVKLTAADWDPRRS